MEVIGERKFFLADSSEPALALRIFSPLQPGCDETGEVPGEVPGVDAIDSMIASLALVGTKVDGLNQSIFGNKLRWEAWQQGDQSQGLPTISDHKALSRPVLGIVRISHTAQIANACSRLLIGGVLTGTNSYERKPWQPVSAGEKHLEAQSLSFLAFLSFLSFLVSRIVTCYP
jgi:hypothetical protein